MAIDVTRLPAEPIVLVSFEPDTKLRVDIPTIFPRIIAERDAITEPISRYFVIIDLTRYSITFGDLIYIMGELKGIGSLRRADRPAYMMVVGMGGIVEMGVKALTQSQYGGYQSRMFARLDEALDTARKAVASERT
jgi:hypothetical protein